MVLLLATGKASNFAKAQESASPLHQQIDELINQRLNEREITPAGKCSDAEFMRRVYLDFTGIIPTADQARAFLDDSAPDKRQRLIDALLASPDYAIHMARVFDVMLMERRIPTISSYDVPAPIWQTYLTQVFAENRPWDQIVRDILGSDGAEGPHAPGVKFYLVRDVSPHQLTRDVGRLFLGMDLQCAQCHDDPHIESYRQADYFGIYAFLERAKSFRDTKNNKSLVGETATGKTTFVSVFTAASGETYPQLPGGQMIPDLAVEKDQEYVVKPGPTERGVPTYSRRMKLAEELPRSQTQGFTRNIVNRIWALMLGRGIVHPLDLHHADNPPSHPELLQTLEQWFVEHHFDIQALLREIALSEVYQRSSELPEGATDVPADAYAVAQLRGLSAEQLSWSLLRAVGRVEQFSPSAAEQKSATQAENIPPAWQQRLNRLQSLERQARTLITVFAGLPGQADGEFQPVVDQALYLLNNPTMLPLIQGAPSTLLNRLVEITEWKPLAEELYLSVLSRRPSVEEAEAAGERIRSAGTPDKRREAITALIWGLLLTSEFRLNH